MTMNSIINFNIDLDLLRSPNIYQLLNDNVIVQGKKDT